MKKLFWASIFTSLLIILFISLAAMVSAAPVNPLPQTVEQSNGTDITIFNYGDEFFNWSEDEDGYIIAYDEQSNNWCYALIDGGSIIPGSQVVGSSEMLRSTNIKIKNDALVPLIEQIDRNAGKVVASPGGSGSGSGSMPSGLMPIDHTKNRQQLLVLLIEYNNRQFTTTYSADTTAYWSSHFFGTTGKTVNTYYREVSEAFDLQFTKPTFTKTNGFSANNPIAGVSSVQIKDGVVKVRLNKNHPNTTAMGTVVRDDVSLAFNAAKQYIDFSGITKTWGTILCEDFNITSVIAGFDASSAQSRTPYIWAHASWSYFNDVNGKQRNISVIGDNLELLTYAAQGELFATNVTMPVGVSVHELGHVLGLPDLYSYIDGYGIGPYSVMANGSWGTDTSGDTKQGNTPTHFDAWSKARLGFTTPTTITSKEYWKNNVNSLAVNYNILQITNTIVDPAQYFMVENRQRTSGFDRGLSGLGVTGSGILLYHIDERVYKGYHYDEGIGGWTGAPNDNNYHKLVHVEKYTPSSNPFYISGGTLTSTSSPNSNFHTVGHTSNPTRHTDCHPQTLASGINIKVNSASGNSMEVEVGYKLTITVPNLAYNGTNNTFTLGAINFSATSALYGKNVYSVINRCNASNTILNTTSNSAININSSGIGTWSSPPSTVNSFNSNEYIEILTYENNTLQTQIARQIVHPIVVAFD